METIETMSEVDKLRAARKQAAEDHAALVETKIETANKLLVEAIEALGHNVTRYKIRHTDWETKQETIEVGGLEYVDDIYFGHDWGFYEQGAVESSYKRKNGNGRLAFRYNEPVTYEKRIIRERNEFVGGFDFKALATVLIALAISVRPAAIEKMMDQARRDMEDDLASRQRKAVDEYRKQINGEGVRDDRIKNLYLSAESWGRSQEIEFTFRVADLETAKAIVNEYFKK